ncbi:unnamed protein product [Cuscuta campestris]|uniref:SGNH hydrolase-type esterase domain-containing protein n=1 Tax=Cuscuta campestris TaxID=132261 RepID=A0A484LIJ7_9ASTE|nr:unnamed protein product [Cuscuta campestris]
MLFLYNCSVLLLVWWVVTSSGGGEAKIKLPEGVVIPAILGFGDSIIDTGMNNYIPTVAKCNFPPYGEDLPDGNPTGRFCNGKTPIDLIAEELGVKETVPPYLDPNLKPEDLKTGVSFASGACGYDPQSSQYASTISLSEQLDYFKEYLEKLKAAFGENETKFVTDNSLFLVVAGSNDISNTYFGLGLRRLQYPTVDSYADFIVHKASTFIQELYGLGGRRIGVFSQVPIGCVPAVRTLAGGSERDCAERYNDAAELANAKLAAEIESLSGSLPPDARVVFIDIYRPMVDVIGNPGRYGLTESGRGCCGTGDLEVSYLCNKLSATTCEEHDKYLFWDSFHPTEIGYKILIDQILPGYVSRFI